MNSNDTEYAPYFPDFPRVYPTNQSDIAVMHGDRYDTRRVIDVGFRMLWYLAEKARERYGNVKWTARTFGQRADLAFDEDLLALIRLEACTRFERYDVDNACCQINAKPFQMRFYPFGTTALQRLPEGEYRTTEGRQVGNLDPMPCLRVSPYMHVSSHPATAGAKGNPPQPTVFTPYGIALVREAWQPLFDQGIEFHASDGLLTAGFPHAIFAAMEDGGEKKTGPLRVRVLR